MTDEQAQCILQNQIEIMGALSLLLRYAKPDLVGKAGELDNQRGDLLQRHKATQRALTPVSRPDCCDLTASVQCSDCPRPTSSVSRPNLSTPEK